MRVAVFGMGHVGLVTAVMLAYYGHDVIGVDVDHEKLALLHAGNLPFYEPDLKSLMSYACNEGRLHFMQDGAAVVRDNDVSLVCVGTPSATDGSVDLGAVCSALDVIAAGLKEHTGYHVVAIRSTIPPAAVDNLVLHLDWYSGHSKCGFCVNPEFLREGSAVKDFANPPFVLIGQADTRAGEQLAGLYAHIRARQIVTDCKTAMLVKYVSNAWHALKVTFANEIGDIAVTVGVNGRALMDIFIQDTALNISGAYLRPGAPFGGSCLPKDLRALVGMCDGKSASVLTAVMHSNDKRVWRIVDRSLATGAQRFAVIGASFKMGTDDVRESPWITVAQRLLDAGKEVRMYDPEVRQTNSLLTDDLHTLLQWAECTIIGKPDLIPPGAYLPEWVIYEDGRCA